MIHITDTAAHNIPPCAGIYIAVNTGFTGTLTLVDGAGTTQAVVTNPGAGFDNYYYGLISSIASPATVTASATGDTTISILSAIRA